MSESTVQHEFPTEIVDAAGPIDERVRWIFCGAFPLKKVVEGRRACRLGWRNRGYPLYLYGKEVSEEDDEGWSMLHVATDLNKENPRLILEREYSDELGDTEPFNSVNDLIASDWYLEVKT